MVKVGIVTDTTSCVPAELREKYGIRLVPVGLVIGGEYFKDTELTNEEFWKLFYQAKKQPTTNAAGSSKRLYHAQGGSIVARAGQDHRVYHGKSEGGR